jgi:hypothetical protein
VYGCARGIVEEAVIDDQLDIVAKLLSRSIGTTVKLATHCTQVHGLLNYLRIIGNRKLHPVNGLSERTDNTDVLLSPQLVQNLYTIP